MSPSHRIIIAGLLSALACDTPTTPGAIGTLTLRVGTGTGGVVALDSGRILIRSGQVTRDVITSPGRTDTIAGLPPGSYTVALEGFKLDAVAYYGETAAPVTVVAGRNTTADISPFAAFTPGTPAFGDTFSIGRTVPLTFGPVGAPSYVVEWSEDQTFASGVQSAATTSTSLQIAVAGYAVYWVRVRAIDRYQHSSPPGGADRIRTVQFGPPRRLRFSRQPQATPAGAPITPGV